MITAGGMPTSISMNAVTSSLTRSGRLPAHPSVRVRVCDPRSTDRQSYHSADAIPEATIKETVPPLKEVTIANGYPPESSIDASSSETDSESAKSQHDVAANMTASDDNVIINPSTVEDVTPTETRKRIVDYDTTLESNQSDTERTITPPTEEEMTPEFRSLVRSPEILGIDEVASVEAAGGTTELPVTEVLDDIAEEEETVYPPPPQSLLSETGKWEPLPHTNQPPPHIV